MINEDKLFRLLPAFFDKPSKVIIEIAQNAFRSGAKNLDISIKDNALRVVDDGSGTNNPHALFCLAESGWSEDVTEQQTPAGWGLFYLMSLSEEVAYTSRFGTVRVDCSAFLNDHAYRDSVLDRVDTSKTTERGFSVEAVLKAGVMKSLDSCLIRRHLRFFRLDITYNGERIKRETLADKCHDYDIKTRYLDNDVYIKTRRSSSLTSLNESFLRGVIMVWYGTPIGGTSYLENVVIDVEKNAPLTPVLPYRSSISFDEKAQKFIEFVRAEVSRWCLAKIRNYDPGCQSARQISDIMDLAADIITQEELDSLDIFHIIEVDPYYSENADADEVQRPRIVHRSEMPLVSEALRLEIDGEVVLDGQEYDLSPDEKPVLPSWSIKNVRLPSKRPAWLTTKEETVCLRVTKQETTDRNFTWTKSMLECPGREIPVLAFPSGYGRFQVYFSREPSDFYLIDDAVFLMNLYSSDDDTYDTQRRKYSESVSTDIQQLTGRYNLYDLLNGINITGVRYDTIRSINVDRESMTIQIIADNGVNVALKLAA